MTTTARMGVGPMSSEIIEATYRYSEKTKKQMMLIASLNQINCNGGYVNGWGTQTLKQYCVAMEGMYKEANVLLCRDHCGPFFMGETVLAESSKNVYANLKADCEAGLDLIHIDFCHIPVRDDREVIAYAREAMDYCLSINPKIRFEIGTDAIGTGVTNTLDLMWILDKVKQYPIEFYVINTGSLIQDFWQAGIFDPCNTQQCTKILHMAGIRAKEHNSDYLTASEIKFRFDCGIDALNVAPQFGVVQTNNILSRALVGDSEKRACLAEWKKEVYEAGNWKKWTDNSEDVLHCVRCAGHYHFKGDNYTRLMEVLNIPQDDLIESAMRVMAHYAN